MFFDMFRKAMALQLLETLWPCVKNLTFSHLANAVWLTSANHWLKRHEKTTKITGDDGWLGGFNGCIPCTLQGINISHLGKRKIIFKTPFLGDMLVPWRVFFMRPTLCSSQLSRGKKAFDISFSRKTSNILASENWCLEDDCFLLGQKAYFQGQMLVLRSVFGMSQVQLPSFHPQKKCLELSCWCRSVRIGSEVRELLFWWQKTWIFGP